MSESNMNTPAKDAQKKVNGSLCEEVGQLFRISSMKKNVNNNDSNQDEQTRKQEMSWETTKAYTMGHKVNEDNQKLIDLRKPEAAATGSWYDNETSPIKVSSASSMIHPSTPAQSSKLNWNTLRNLLDEDNTILTPKGIEMLKANTHRTEEQIGEWHAGILRDCPNGKLSKDQIIAAYEQIHSDGKGKDFCKYAFATFGRDNTGTIEFYEFMLTFGLTQSNDLNLRLALAFDLHNYNRTETMDADQLAKAISTLYDFIGETDRTADRDPKHRAEEIIRSCDVTDEKLSRKEFITGCKEDPVIRRLLVRDV